MEGYPNSDEEFEAMYADELELLRENENHGDPAAPKSRKVLDFPTVTKTPVKVLQNVLVTSSESLALNSSFDRDFTPIEDKVPEDNQPGSSQMTIADLDKFIADNSQGEKRSYSSLFGDISDLDEDMKLPKPKKLKLDKVKNIDEELALIEHIVEMRKLAKEKNDPGATFAKSYVKCTSERLRENLSYSLPKYPCLTVKQHDGSLVYMRFHSEEYEKEERDRVTKDLSFNGVLGDRFKEVWAGAKRLLEKEAANLTEEVEDVSAINLQDSNNSLLWVDVYKPRKYVELLSDEGTNRTLLRWLKLWDKVVFNRKPKILIKPQNQQFQKFQLNTELDEHGRPFFKVALLCGPPGLGKTTLAHMVARHAGYKVIEVNASDERNIESFKKALDNATQMTSVLDYEKRPNCLVFDEIDGAPSASIDFLIKYISGNHSAKSKKGKKSKSTILKRPIICICNDVYVPALRALRQISFVVHFPPTTTARLATRLHEIAVKEGIDAHSSALVALGEKSNNDIRSCLSVLHFFKTENKPVTLGEIGKVSIGQKDIQKGLFTVWQDIFQIERPKSKEEVVTLASRWKKVLGTVSSFGDYNRVAQGVFENYPSMNVRDSSLVGTCLALDWFCFSDIVSTKVNTTQNYSLSNYLQYGFIVWHYVFASSQWSKLTYPSVAAEVRAKTTKHSGLLTEVLKGMKPSVRAYTNRSSINLDILPLLSEIITPPLRPVNLHLYTPQEKEELHRIVSTMIDYNLNYVQERNQEGSYVFSIDPNIEEVVKFSTSKTKRILSYSNRQLISREIEIEKMRRVELSKKVDYSTSRTAAATRAPATTEQKELPNHLQRLKPKSMKTSSSTAPRNFFVLSTNKASNQDKDNSHSAISGDIWYEFKEGHTNAVKKTMKISSWF